MSCDLRPSNVGIPFSPLPAAFDSGLSNFPSSLNYSFSSTERNTAREPDDKRLTDFISEENFGMVEIDWAARTFTMSLLGAGSVRDGSGAGDVRVTETVSW